MINIIKVLHLPKKQRIIYIEFDTHSISSGITYTPFLCSKMFGILFILKCRKIFVMLQKSTIFLASISNVVLFSIHTYLIFKFKIWNLETKIKKRSTNITTKKLFSKNCILQTYSDRRTTIYISINGSKIVSAAKRHLNQRTQNSVGSKIRHLIFVSITSWC